MDEVRCPKCGTATVLGFVHLRIDTPKSWRVAKIVVRGKKRTFLEPQQREGAVACPKCKWVMIPA